MERRPTLIARPWSPDDLGPAYRLVAAELREERSDDGRTVRWTAPDGTVITAHADAAPELRDGWIVCTGDARIDVTRG
jgi:uncharacterized protein YoaH (UPF0181 family)